MARPGMWQGYDDGHSGAWPRSNGDEEYYIAYGIACAEDDWGYGGPPQPEPTAEEICAAYTQHGLPYELTECLDAIAQGMTVWCHCGAREFSREELCAMIDDPDPED